MNNFHSAIKGEYIIDTNPDLIDIKVVHAYLSNESYWAKNIPLETVQRSIENSFCFGIYHNNQQIGFARLITDKATFAYLADVFILPEHRKRGLSKWLMEFMQNHPELQGLRRWMLATKDAHGLYTQFGWLQPTEEQASRLMMLLNQNVYK